jgi:hypothetical protein
MVFESWSTAKILAHAARHSANQFIYPAYRRWIHGAAGIMTNEIITNQDKK